MTSSLRPLIDELLDWIDREIERPEKGRADESGSRPEDERETDPRERLRVPSSIPA